MSGDTDRNVKVGGEPSTGSEGTPSGNDCLDSVVDGAEAAARSGREEAAEAEEIVVVEEVAPDGEDRPANPDR